MMQHMQSTSTFKDPGLPPLAADLTDGEILQRYFGEFQSSDAGHDYKVVKATLAERLVSTKLVPSIKDAASIVEQVSAQESADTGQALVDCDAFCTMMRTVLVQGSTKALNPKMRLGRMYMQAEQHQQYLKMFQELAGVSGLVSHEDMTNLLTTKLQVTLPAEKVSSTMADIDEAGSGTLDFDEFMTVLVKCLGLKKRKLGPNLCSIPTLLSEGWSPHEIRRLGFEGRHFLESGFQLQDLLALFSPVELRRCGASTKELVDMGWSCRNAREAGFSLEDLLSAGATIRMIREAGFDDASSAVALRKLNVQAQSMKSGGWPLSELRAAGYSTLDLRMAGFSVALLAATQRAHEQHRGWKERRCTQDIRLGCEMSLPTAEAKG
mmetsp:Transcript_12384/g.29116  ORF Transcript_12384/g.29116 Transcript_12384/m.29116 type:complete len:380 (+) Transcript_12384:115-1254(+)